MSRAVGRAGAGRTPSLRARLAVVLVLVLGLSLGAFSLLLYAAFGRALWRQFDRRLAEDARAVANMVEERARGPWEFEPGPIDGAQRPGGGAYFEAWMDDGSVLGRSPSLGGADLPRAANPSRPIHAAVRLPDGRAGRELLVALPPRLDDEGPPTPSGRLVTVAVERATSEVAATMATLRLLLLGSGLCALVLAALAGLLALRRGLEPVARLARRVDEIDAARLGDRLPVADLPGELRPAVERLNGLLSRLEESFARERRFSADASHELRTPLAALRSILEVAASRERGPAEYRAALDAALEVVRQTGALVENLLLLARLDARQVRVASEPVELRRLVDECFAPLAERAGARRLRFENRVPPERVVTSDREKLRLIVANLLANAVEYTEPGGRIEAVADPSEPPNRSHANDYFDEADAAEGGAPLLEIRDSGPPIPEHALERIFDRFFRLDSARAGTGEHCGIGLALVRALCEALDLEAAAENGADGSVAFRVRSARPRLDEGVAATPPELRAAPASTRADRRQA